jgi:single-strand DNA-binding protein
MLRVFLAGNLGRDAELKDVNGTPLASFSVAVTQRIKREKVTTWIGCALFGARAPALATFLTKGTRVAVAGELTTRTSEKNGKTYLECRVDDVTLLGGGGEGGGQRSNRPAAPPDDDQGSYGAAPAGGDDDIPFILNVTSDAAERWWKGL